jgi:DUF4097 and DUF4098 domain-containing protein YvlB
MAEGFREITEITMMSKQDAAKLVLVGIVAAGTSLAWAEARKEFRFAVHAGSNVSVTNPYGSVSVKPGNANTVVVTAILQSSSVEVDQYQHGNRVEVSTHLLPGADPDSGKVDYEVLVPSDASVDVHSASGPLRAEKMRGDIAFESTTGSVDVRETANAHVHVKTLSGPVSLTDIRGGHVEITSISGDVTLTSVTGPYVQVSSSSGKIVYNGDFGSGGEYSLTSHTGDIEATAPQGASIDVVAQSARGTVDSDFSLEPRHTSFTVKAGSAFAGTMNKALSMVKLRSFSGKIHLKKR